MTMTMTLTAANLSQMSPTSIVSGGAAQAFDWDATLSRARDPFFDGRKWIPTIDSDSLVSPESKKR